MAYATDTRAARASLAQRIGELRASLTDRVAKYKVYRQTVNELTNLTDRELADLGIHRSMIGEIADAAAYGK